jgi:hypothetical protein
LKSKKNHALSGIIGCILLIGGLVYLEIFHKENIKDLFAPILSLLSVGLMYFTKKLDDISDKINGVRPIWKLIKVNNKVEFFSQDKGKSVLSNVRYYSLIVDNNNSILSINNDSEEIPNSYITSNAVVESETVYSSDKSSSTKNFTFEQPKDGQKRVVIIESTTIYDEKTYFFESNILSGGFTSNFKVYSGKWNKNTKNIAIKYIEEINRRKKCVQPIPSATTVETTKH